MLHIENLTVHIQSGPSAISRAFIEALLRGPELNDSPVPDTPADAPAASTASRIGEYWQGQGGIYCGMARGEDGQPDYPLILAETAPEQDFNWKDAQEFAKTVVADGHTDFTLPTRFESALVYANVRDKLNTERYHWTSTQYSESNAWLQTFLSGFQFNVIKSYEARCRFVRRLAL